MEERQNTPGKQIVPPQEEGMRTGAAQAITCRDRSEALEEFHAARDRMRDVNSWTSLSGMMGAEFRLTDRYGNRVPDLGVGNYIRINLPGPGPRAGEGYDWVRVEEIQNGYDEMVDEEWTAFRVRPAPMPGSDEREAAHFYREEATSTFIIKRMGNHVTAAVGGRNEIPNTGTRNPMDNLRNAAYAVGAQQGIAEMQWKKLMEGILKGSDQ